MKVLFFHFCLFTIRLVMNDYMPWTSFQLFGPSRGVIALRHQFPHQHMQPIVAEGPTHYPNFRNRVWTFHVQGVDLRLSMHQSDPPTVQRAVFETVLTSMILFISIWIVLGLSIAFNSILQDLMLLLLVSALVYWLFVLFFLKIFIIFLLQELCFLLIGCILF